MKWNTITKHNVIKIFSGPTWLEAINVIIIIYKREREKYIK